MQPRMRVLDFGTGTGILAIAAAKLGANVVAVEKDPSAIALAGENFVLNNIVIPIVQQESLEGEYDLILANVGKTAGEELMPLFYSHLADWGKIVISKEE